MGQGNAEREARECEVARTQRASGVGRSLAGRPVGDYLRMIFGWNGGMELNTVRTSNLLLRHVHIDRYPAAL